MLVLNNQKSPMVLEHQTDHGENILNSSISKDCMPEKSSIVSAESRNDFAVEFLTETIPHYAADPGWRSIFEELANLSEEERVGMLQKLGNNIPLGLPGLVPEKQLSLGLAFLRLNLEDPLNPRMMVKMIDYENHRVQKILCDQIKEFMTTEIGFNPAEFIMDAFFHNPLPGATWTDVLQVCVELSDSERISYLDLLRSAPDNIHIPKAFARLLVYNLENPSHAEAMIQAIEEGLIDMSSLRTHPNGEEEVVCDDRALA